MVDIKQKIVDEYSEEYCHALELAFGKGMMSEGGVGWCRAYVF